MSDDYLEIKCPNCGGETGRENRFSLMVICDYCQYALIVDEDIVKVAGEMSLLTDPPSLLYVGAEGKLKGKDFSVVGRVQYRYRNGLWDEWYLDFGDGHRRWISQDEEEYTLEDPFVTSGVKPFDFYEPGTPLGLDDINVSVDEKDTAECVGGQGELPFVLTRGEQIPYLDASNETEFVTVEYDNGDDAAPTVFKGIWIDKADIDVDELPEGY